MMVRRGVPEEAQRREGAGDWGPQANRYNDRRNRCEASVNCDRITRKEQIEEKGR